MSLIYKNRRHCLRLAALVLALIAICPPAKANVLSPIAPSTQLVSAQWVMPPTADCVDLQICENGYVLARRSGDAKDRLYGYLDIYGNEVLPFVYDVAAEFSEGLAFVKTKTFTPGAQEKTGFINESGELVISLSNDVRAATPFRNGRAIIYFTDSTTGLIDTKGNDIVAPGTYYFEYDSLRTHYSDLILFSQTKKIPDPNATDRSIEKTTAGVLDANGKVLFTVPDVTFDGADNDYIAFSKDVDYEQTIVAAEGLAPEVRHYSERKQGVMDKNGNIIIPAEYGEFSLPGTNGSAEKQYFTSLDNDREVNYEIYAIAFDEEGNEVAKIYDGDFTFFPWGLTGKRMPFNTGTPENPVPKQYVAYTDAAGVERLSGVDFPHRITGQTALYQSWDEHPGFLGRDVTQSAVVQDAIFAAKPRARYLYEGTEELIVAYGDADKTTLGIFVNPLIADSRKDRYLKPLLQQQSQNSVPMEHQSASSAK